MAVSYEPNDIVCYFLRSQVTEPTRVGISPTTRTATGVYSPTGNGVTTEYTITPASGSLCSVTSVTVAGTAVQEYVTFTVDVTGSKVIFAAAPSNGAAIVITYVYGANWIYTDDPRDDLSSASYPRIAIHQLDENEISKQGIGETDTYDSVVIQIDVIAYKDAICTISGSNMEGAKVAATIARNVVNRIRRYADSKIGAKLFKPQILSKRRVPFEEDQGRYRHLIDVRFEAFNLGES